jgi:tRNA(Arg) A34 adenosine deaminase TadA
MNPEEEWMQLAIEEAAKAPWPFGAVIVRDGVVLSKAGAGDGQDNLIDPTAHAETNAVRFACKALNSSNLAGATMYASCEPCALCMGAIWYAGVRTVVYGSSIPDEEALFHWKDLAIPAEVLQGMTEGKLKVQGGFMRDKVMDMYRAHSLSKKVA